jgi:hypothetical protein
MGFFDDVGNFFRHPIDSIGNAFNQVGMTIKNGINSLGNGNIGMTLSNGFNSIGSGVSGLVGTLYNDGKSAVSSLHMDARDLIGGFGTTVIGGGQDVIKNLASSARGVASDVTSNLALPIAIGLGVLGLVFLNKK